MLNYLDPRYSSLCIKPESLEDDFSLEFALRQLNNNSLIRNKITLLEA